MPAAVSLSQMVDLSLGTPEVGAVNFNVMHTLLHAIIKKLNIGDHKAEINEHDRDFLATSKIRAKSTLSDADSGKGEDSEDGISEKSGVPPFRPTPYHRLELKVEKLAQQLEELNQLPSNVELFNRATKSKGDSSSERPMADMWQYMQLKKRVDANEEGVGKLFSLIEDMMKEMKELKDANQRLQDQIKGLNVDDLMKKLAELEKITTDLKDKFSLLPTPEELNQFVTWPALEDALKGIRDDLVQPPEPPERVVIEVSSQTEPPSRPGSSRLSRVSTPGPSEQLLDILERLGKLDSDHNILKERVDVIEEELKNKLDKSAIEGLGVPPEMLEQIGQLKEQLDALSADRDKTNSPNFHAPPNDFVSCKTLTNEQASPEKQWGSTLGRLKSSGRFLSAVVTVLSKIRQKSSQQVSSEGKTDTDIEPSSSEEIMAAIQGDQTTTIALTSLQERLGMLEDRFKLFQGMLLDDSAYHSDMSDLTSWLAQMESKIADNLTDMGSVEEPEEPETSQVEEVKKKPSVDKHFESTKEEKPEPPKKRKPREEVEERLTEEEAYKQDLDEILEDSALVVPELNETNDKLKKLAYSLNDQLHGLRDKVFLVDQELKRMAKGVEFALMRAKVAGISEMEGNDDLDMIKQLVQKDSDALTRAQHAILQLQAEVEKLHHTTADIIDENKHRTLQIEDILKYCDRLQQEKADKDYVQMEVDVKADKKSLDAKVNTKLFDQTTDEINKMIKEILEKLAGHLREKSEDDEDWKTAYSKLTEDIDGKLDRLELDPLKEWLEARLKALNDKLKKYQKSMDWSEDDAAGIRKQLIQRFHCISCDRPVDMMPTGAIPSLPAQGGLPATRSPRPYTTYELEQIRQHAKSRLAIGRNTLNFERAIAERQLATMKKSDLRAFLVHFKHDFDLLTQQSPEHFTNPEITDYYATPRPCGGSHTLTFPHKRNTKLTHLSHLFRDETIVVPATRDDGEIQGADGHIYRGRADPSRHQKLEARLPTKLGTNNNNTMSVHVRASSPQPPQTKRPASSVLVTHRARPMSARTPPSPRPASAVPSSHDGSRPQSAKVVKTQEPEEAPQIPQAEFVDEAIDEVQATMEVNKQEPIEEQNVEIDASNA